MTFAPGTARETPATTRDPHRVPRWLVLTLVLLTLLVRERAMYVMGGVFERDPDGFGKIAWRLQRDGAFNRTEHRADGPTAYRAPLYPLVLAAWTYRSTPLGSIWLLHALLGAATVWGVCRLSEEARLPLWATVTAALLVAIDPILINQSMQIMSETLAAFLATWGLVALARLARQPAAWRALVAGAWLGLGVLCRPEMLAWSACVAVALPWTITGGRRRSFALTALAVVVAALVVAPWPARNGIQLGRPIVTTTHGGYTLLLANNPYFYEYLRSGAWGSVWRGERFHEEWRDESRRLLVNTGPRTPPNIRTTFFVRDELATDRRAYELAWQNIRAEPGMFAYSCLVRIGRLWAVLPHATTEYESTTRRGLRYSVAIWYVAEFVLALVGLWSLGRQLRTSPWLWCLLLAGSFTAAHALYWTDMRMRAPLASAVALAAAAGVVRLAAGRRVATPDPTAA
ncbi:MAG: hypothetical protein AB7O59_18475 [Pirellulales bacterium]